jgi:hypothetical protein
VELRAVVVAAAVGAVVAAVDAVVGDAKER